MRTFCVAPAVPVAVGADDVIESPKAAPGAIGFANFHSPFT
jgi:hypothetical protein